MESIDKAIVGCLLAIIVFIGALSYIDAERKLKCISLVTDKSATEIMAVCK